MLKWLNLTTVTNNHRITTRVLYIATPSVEMQSKAAAPAKEIAVDFAVKVIYLKPTESVLEFIPSHTVT